MSLSDKKVWLNGSDYIELDSVGSTLTSELIVFPTIDSGEAPETASEAEEMLGCLLYTSPSPRDGLLSRMPSSA